MNRSKPVERNFENWERNNFEKQGDASERQRHIEFTSKSDESMRLDFHNSNGEGMDSNFVRLICETLPRGGKLGKRRRLVRSRVHLVAPPDCERTLQIGRKEALPSSLHEQFHFHPWKMYANHLSRRRESQGTARDNEFAGLSDFLGTRSW